MKFGMGSVGAGSLIWLVATACGETNDASETEQASNGSGGSTSSTGATGSGAMGSNTTGAVTGTGTTGPGTTATNGPGSTSVGSGGTSSSSCPSVEPAIGASCADEGLSCTFTNCTAPNYRNDHTLSCEQGAWTLASEVECLANCPDTAPDIGSPCEIEETPGPCPVETACGMTEAYCVEGAWSLSPSGSDRAPEPPGGVGGSSGIIGEPLCPESQPASYTPCCPALTPDYCDYRVGRSDLLPPNTVSTTTGAQGSGGASGSASTTGGTGGTGGTGATLFCLTCDRTQLVWMRSDACP